jgi:hypothetical protein
VREHHYVAGTGVRGSHEQVRERRYESPSNLDATLMIETTSSETWLVYIVQFVWLMHSVCVCVCVCVSVCVCECASVAILEQAV